MVWFKNVRVALNERVVVLDGGLPRVALAPGRHRVWGRDLTEVRFDTDTLAFWAEPAIRQVLPTSWYQEITLSTHERGVLMRDGKPMTYLRPGTRRYWTVDPSVTLTVWSVDEPMPALTDELMRVIPASEYARTVVDAHEHGVLYVRGTLRKVLAPGVYAVWSHPEAPVRIQTLDARLQQLTLAGQELMTRDKVTLRLTLTTEHVLADPAKVALSVVDARDTVYLLVQLAARDYVAGVTLDALLEGRSALTEALEREVVPQAAALGIRVGRVGVKDVVLPGEMKALLNRVIEAEKEAAANVILRREEAAATRLLANTARMMVDQPMLLRLKELDTLKEMAGRIDEVRVVVGADGGLERLLSAQALGAVK